MSIWCANFRHGNSKRDGEDIDIVADMYFEELKNNDAGMYIFYHSLGGIVAIMLIDYEFKEHAIS